MDPVSGAVSMGVLGLLGLRILTEVAAAAVRVVHNWVMAVTQVRADLSAPSFQAVQRFLYDNQDLVRGLRHTISVEAGPPGTPPVYVPMAKQGWVKVEDGVWIRTLQAGNMDTGVPVGFAVRSWATDHGRRRQRRFLANLVGAQRVAASMPTATDGDRLLAPAAVELTRTS